MYPASAMSLALKKPGLPLGGQGRKRRNDCRQGRGSAAAEEIAFGCHAWNL